MAEPPVKPFVVQPVQFGPGERRAAAHLATLPGVLDDQVMTPGPDRGWFAGGWWRTNGAPHNARSQELVAVLSYFHRNEAAWNPYRRDARLLRHLDAGLEHLLQLQHEDGTFPAYGPDDHNRAATGFGLVTLARTLDDLRVTDSLPLRRRQLLASLRRAADWVLHADNQEFWVEPVDCANQAVAALLGVRMLLDLDPDADRQSLLHKRLDHLVVHGQSPVGYFREPRGGDLRYSFEVELPDLADLYRLTGHDGLLEAAGRFVEWLGLTLVPTPDGGYVPYDAASTRSEPFTVAANPDHLLDKTTGAAALVGDIPELAAFLLTKEDQQQQYDRWHTADAPEPVLPRGTATSPRGLWHDRPPTAAPTAAAHEAARRQLPPLARSDFTVTRHDPAGDRYHFVRRPGYYLCAFTGRRPTVRVRSGPGLLWGPDFGCLIRTLNGSDAAWGYRGDGLDEATADLVVETVDRDGVQYRHPDAPLRVSLGYLPRWLRRTVVSPAGIERIPLCLEPTDEVWVGNRRLDPDRHHRGTADRVRILRRGVAANLNWGETRSVALAPIGSTAPRPGLVLDIAHEGHLELLVEIEDRPR